MFHVKIDFERAFQKNQSSNTILKSSVHCGYYSIGQTFLAGERRKKKSLDWYTEMYVFVNNFVHFTFQALKLEKSSTKTYKYVVSVDTVVLASTTIPYLRYHTRHSAPMISKC